VEIIEEERYVFLYDLGYVLAHGGRKREYNSRGE
jgi:hypothetical protein